MILLIVSAHLIIIGCHCGLKRQAVLFDLLLPVSCANLFTSELSVRLILCLLLSHLIFSLHLVSSLFLMSTRRPRFAALYLSSRSFILSVSHHYQNCPGPSSQNVLSVGKTFNVKQLTYQTMCIAYYDSGSYFLVIYHISFD